MKKALFYFSQNDLGGHTRFVVELSAEMIKSGYSCHVYIPHLSHFYYTREVLKDGKTFRRTVRYLASQAKRIYRSRGVQWQGLKMNPNKELKISRYWTSPKLKFLESFDVIFTSAHWHVDELEKSGFQQRDKILHIIHHAHTDKRDLVEDYFKDGSVRVVTSSNQTRIECEGLGIQVEQTILLGVRAITAERTKPKKNSVSFFYYKHPRKNPELILATIKTLIDKSDCQIIILGNGFKNQLGNPRITVMENLEDHEYQSVIAESKVFVYISRKEGFGLPPLEAMALGTACVASATGAIPEYGNDQKNIFLIQEGHDQLDIAEKVISLLNNDVLRKEIESNGLLTSERFSIANTAEKYLEMID